jgi:hypothetical protein
VDIKRWASFVSPAYFRGHEMRDALRWIGRALLVLIVVVAVVFAAYRIRGPSFEQRAALDLLQQDRRPDHGRNAFPLLWFMGYDVADEDLDAHMAVDVAEVRKRLAAGDEAIQFVPSASKLPQPSNDDAGPCQTLENDCLHHVTEKAELTRSTLKTYARLLARAQSLEHADFLWIEFPADYRTPMGMYSVLPQNLWLSSLALQFVDGDHVGALDGVCRNARTWRRLRAATNSLIGDMVLIRYADGAIRLFGEMLAASSSDEAIPPSCMDAFRPIEAADVDRCAELSTERAVSENVMREISSTRQPYWKRVFSQLIFDPRQTVAWGAEQFTPYCGEAASRRLLADKTIDLNAVPHPLRRLECITSVTGCILTEIATPAYVGYDKRILDYAAHLRLAATLIWLRESPIASAASLKERFEQRPANLRSAGHVSGIDSEHHVLFVDSLNQVRAQRFELKLSAE